MIGVSYHEAMQKAKNKYGGIRTHSLLIIGHQPSDLIRRLWIRTPAEPFLAFRTSAVARAANTVGRHKPQVRRHAGLLFIFLRLVVACGGESLFYSRTSAH